MDETPKTGVTELELTPHDYLGADTQLRQFESGLTFLPSEVKEEPEHEERKHTHSHVKDGHFVLDRDDLITDKSDATPKIGRQSPFNDDSVDHDPNETKKWRCVIAWQTRNLNQAASPVLAKPTIDSWDFDSGRGDPQIRKKMSFPLMMKKRSNLLLKKRPITRKDAVIDPDTMLSEDEGAHIQVNNQEGEMNSLP